MLTDGVVRQPVAIADLAPDPLRWQGPEIDALMELALVGNLDVSEARDNHVVLALMWLHERGWSAVHHLSMVEGASRAFVCPRLDLLAVIDIGDGATQAVPSDASLIDRLRHLGLGALASCIEIAAPKVLRVRPSENLVEERFGRVVRTCPLRSQGKRPENTIGGGHHANVGSNYFYRRSGRGIHVSQVAVHVPGADPDDEAAQWMLNAALGHAEENPSLGDQRCG